MHAARPHAAHLAAGPAPRADGSLYDACLLAALATLASLRLHAVTVDDSGRIHKASEDGTAAEAGAAAAAAAQRGAAPQRGLQLGCQPVGLTCGVYRGQLLVDPTAEEEPLLDALLTATVDEQGDVLGEGRRLAGQGLRGARQPLAMLPARAQRPPARGLHSAANATGRGRRVGAPRLCRVACPAGCCRCLPLLLAWQLQLDWMGAIPLLARRPPAGFHKAGGSATASQQRVLECIEAAKMRGREVRGLLQQALEAAGAADGGAAAGAS